MELSKRMLKICNTFTGWEGDDRYPDRETAEIALRQRRNEFYTQPGSQNWKFCEVILPTSAEWQFNQQSSKFEWVVPEVRSPRDYYQEFNSYEDAVSDKANKRDVVLMSGTNDLSQREYVVCSKQYIDRLMAQGYAECLGMQ